MTTISAKAAGLAGLVVALAVIGSLTALAITGHISGADALTGIGFIAAGGTGVVGAHIGGSVAANAAAAPAAPADPVAAAAGPAGQPAAGAPTGPTSSAA